MHLSHVRAAAAIVVATLALAACGGDDDGDSGSAGNPPPTQPPNTGTTIPASATASVPNLLAYVRELIAGTNETDEPVMLGNAVLPTDDNAEPAPVN